MKTMSIATAPDLEIAPAPAHLLLMPLRAWRLQRYLANNPDVATKSLDSGKG